MYPNRRLNIFTGERFFVSPLRSQRPWYGKVENLSKEKKTEYNAKCYFYHDDERENGNTNPAYYSTFVFDNDFSSLKIDIQDLLVEKSDLIIMKAERGICRVVCFPPKYDLTLTELIAVIKTWQKEYEELGRNPNINYVQILENKAELIECSNTHQHRQLKYYQHKKETLLNDYLRHELEKQERIVYKNSGFVLSVPSWALWSFEIRLYPQNAFPIFLN